MVDPRIFELGVPVLGVCYGLQLMAKLLGGAIDRTAHREYGHARLEVLEAIGPFREMRKGEHLDVWMSHGDKVAAPPRGFKVIARSENSPYCAVASSMNAPMRKEKVTPHSSRNASYSSRPRGVCATSGSNWIAYSRFAGSPTAQYGEFSLRPIT